MISHTVILTTEIRDGACGGVTFLLHRTPFNQLRDTLLENLGHTIERCMNQAFIGSNLAFIIQK